MIDTNYLHNPGRYGHIHSSEDKRAMLYGDSAYFDTENHRWFEYIGCEYECYLDAVDQRKADDNDIMSLAKNIPELSHKEVYYTLDYNSSGDKVDLGQFIFTEYGNSKVREFILFVRDISMEEAQEYINAAIDWHYTNRFEIGRLSFFPCSGPWAQIY
jgi:hypothetical protein